MSKSHLLKESQIRITRDKGQKSGPRAESVVVSKEEFYHLKPDTTDKSTIRFQVQTLQKSVYK